MVFRRKSAALVAGAFALLVGALPQSTKADEVLKVGTLAPKQSIWGQVFEVWKTAVDKKSEGKLKIEFFYNGQQGDEGIMVGKMKAGQLDGAAVTAVGLSKIYKPILALQLPGTLTTWAKVDTAQSALRSEFEKGVNDNKFTILGWGNVGIAHFFSKGSAVKTPDDLKGHKPYVWRDDTISPVFYQVVGVSPVPLNVTEVLPNLKTGAVDALNAPSLAAEQLQWAPELGNVIDDATGCAVGALVFQSKRVNDLPGDLRTILTDTGAIATNALGKKVRDEDDAAYGRLKGKMNVTTLSDSDKAAWAAKFAETRKRLNGEFDGALIKKIEGFGGL